jgi:hypothetical protein
MWKHNLLNIGGGKEELTSKRRVKRCLVDNQGDLDELLHL